MAVPIVFTNKESENKQLFISKSTVKPDWCAYFHPGNPVGDTMTLEDIWRLNTAGGCFLFANKQPEIDENSFVKNVKDYIDLLDPDNKSKLYYMWLFDPEKKLASTNVSHFKIQLGMSGYYKIENDVHINFGKYIDFSIFNGCAVSFDKELNHFYIEPVNKGDIKLCPDLQTCPDIQRVYIPFEGPSRGCFRFNISLSGAGDLKSYNAGLKYFYRENNQGNVIVKNFSIIDDNYFERLDFQVSLDPLDQFNTEGNAMRTYFSFSNTSVIIPTYFRTTFGYAVRLSPCLKYLPNTDKLPYDIPEEDSAKLVFSRQSKSEVSDGLPAYMVFQGDFNINTTAILSAEKPAINILCGLSGIEAVSCIPKKGNYPGDVMSFVPGKPAYAPVFPIPGSAEYIGKELLEDSYETAWIGFKTFPGRPVPAAGENWDLKYLSQPEGSPLYHAVDDSGILGFHELPSARLDLYKVLSFPMVSFGGFSRLDDNMRDFEKKLLSPARKKAVEAVVIPLELASFNAGNFRTVGNEDTIISTTPQGLLIETDKAGNIWNRLTLAQNIGQGHMPGQNILQFNSLNPVLKSAFQTNQQFLVISISKNLGSFDNDIKLEGWPFSINVPESQHGNYENVLLFKFCEGRLIDRVRNPRLWTNPGAFNEPDNMAIDTLSDWLGNYIQDGIDRYEKNNDSDFYYFSKIVQDTNWNGILALNTDVSINSFPKDLQGLLGGIELSRFRAHHFGINQNNVTVDPSTGKLVMNPNSSMFALVDYIDIEFKQYSADIEKFRRMSAPGNISKYDFKVLSLKILFENSKIKSFNSYMQLVANELFGDKVGSENGGNQLIFKGVYENHSGVPAYTFDLVGTSRLSIKSNVLTSVDVQKAAFSTVLSDKDGDTSRVHARFSLWGYLDFANLEGLDLFSFGDGKGLSYSSLLINLYFSLAASHDKSFEFDPSQVAFDTGASITRKGSLVEHFPMQLTGLAYGSRDNLPSGNGYLDVKLPDLIGAGNVSGDWYGLEFSLNMGTMGALAGKAGLSTKFMALWGTGSQGVAAAIQLPGVNSKSKALSIQGVLKTNFKDIKLVAGKTQEGGNAFILMLNGISLQFLFKKIPPNGDMDFYLFGNPDEDAQPGSLGWYAAYQDNR